MRFLYIITRDTTVIGSSKEGTHVQPFGMGIAAVHCRILKDPQGNCTVVAVEGDTYVNGRKLKPGESAALALYDRLVMATEVGCVVCVRLCACGERAHVTSSSSSSASFFLSFVLSLSVSIIVSFFLSFVRSFSFLLSCFLAFLLSCFLAFLLSFFLFLLSCFLSYHGHRFRHQFNIRSLCSATRS
jgi:hypothetical protein